MATVTAVQPPGRFGALECDHHKVTGFCEKPSGDNGWINGGFFVLEPSVIDLIEDESTIWERHTLSKLQNNGELMAFFHDGFWHPMDTLRDNEKLNEFWDEKKAPWKKW